jgi:shikimate kinase
MMQTPANDYYAYQPTIRLRQPLVVTGYPGLPFRTLAYELAEMTGLSLTDVDRWVEHEVGTSLSSLVREQGMAALRRRQATLVSRSLATSPPRLLVISDQVLLEPSTFDAVRAAANTIYFYSDRATLFWKTRQWTREHGVLPHPSLPTPLERPQQLDGILAARSAVLQQADRTFRLEGEPDQATMDHLLLAVEQLTAEI